MLTINLILMWAFTLPVLALVCLALDVSTGTSVFHMRGNTMSLQPSAHDDEHGGTSDYWDGYDLPEYPHVDHVALVLVSDDELATMSDAMDMWPEDDDYPLVVAFDDGLGFDWPHVDADSEATF